MKSLNIMLALFVSAAGLSSQSVAQDEYPILNGPYMGQKTPGKIAEPFAPGIISKDGWELEGVFSPNMKEFYYTKKAADGKKSIIVGFRQTNNSWKKYIEIPRRGEVSFSPDGKRMHMAKGYIDRVDDGWTELQKVDPMINTKDFGVMRLSASEKSTYVFDDYLSGEIRISEMKNGKRQKPTTFDSEVNTGKWTAHPFIAPDESYLIWDTEREGGFGGTDLYIRFRQNDGSWGPAINMGENVNSDKSDFFASVTSDGKYILFNRTMSKDPLNIDIYWADAQFIEDLRPKN